MDTCEMEMELEENAGSGGGDSLDEFESSKLSTAAKSESPDGPSIPAKDAQANDTCSSTLTTGNFLPSNDEEIDDECPLPGKLQRLVVHSNDSVLMDESTPPAELALNANDDAEVAAVALPPIPSLLEEYECYFTWIDRTNEDNPFTKEEAIIVKRIIDGKFDPDDTDLPTLCYNGMKVIGDKCTQAFCNLFLNDIDAGAAQISEANALIHKCIDEKHFPEEYSEGFYYITRGLHLLQLCCRIEKSSGFKDAQEELGLMMENVSPFDQLPPKGQVAVRAVEYLFYDKRLEKSPQAVERLEKIIEMDDNYYQWHYELYKQLRNIRRSRVRFQYQGSEQGGPSEKETLEVIKAAELAPNNPYIKMGLCQCLVQIFRDRYKKRQFSENNPIDLESFGTFASSNDVIEFLHNIARETQELPSGASACVRMSEFFSSGLPKEFQDFEFAKECILRSGKTSPKSSKRNHRMGLLLLTDPHPGNQDPKGALEYFKIAVERDPRNFPALCDMIRTLMSDCNLYAEELTNVFTTNLANPGAMWADDKLGNLYYLYGLFKYMLKDESAAVDSWIKAYSISKESIKSLKSIPYNCNRYNWSHAEVSIQKIHSVLMKGAEERAESSDDEKEILQNILDMVVSLVYDYRERKSKYGNGGGRQRGAWSHGGRGSRGYPPRGRGYRGTSSHHGHMPQAQESACETDMDWRK